MPPLTVGGLPDCLPEVLTERVFTMGRPPIEFQWLRTPYPERLFTMTGAALRTTGRESIGSWFEQALVARRPQHHAYDAATVVQADPPNWQRAAGLVPYDNSHKFPACLMTHEPGLGRCLRVGSCNRDWQGQSLTWTATEAAPDRPITDGPITLAVQVNGATQRFLRGQGDALAPRGPALDASIIPVEGGKGEHASFTGAFVGMFAHDLTGRGWTADFTRFTQAPAELTA